MAKRLKRSEVPEHLTWNLKDLFPDDETWEKELQAAVASVGDVTKFKGRLGEGPQVLLECLGTLERFQARFMKVASYASLKLSGDGTDPANQALAMRVGAAGSQISAAMSFFNTEVLSLPNGTLERYLREEPKLGEFRRNMELLLERKPHMLEPQTEMVLASLGEVLSAPSAIYSRSKAADMTFEPVVDGEGNTLPMAFAVYEGRYERSSDTVLRRNAWASFTKGLSAYKNTYGATFGTEVKRNVVMAKLRGYESATHMFLKGQEVTLDVYNNLHDVILTELAPHMRRYVALRKEVLGLDEILYCDIEAPLDPEFSPKTTFEEASEIILGGISTLGPEYREVIAEGLSNRWIDLADNIGKSTGAFCSSIYGVHPYVLVTWSDNMRDALMLAHELGHAGHGVFSQRYQRLSNCRTSMFFIEGPSIINELLVADYILSQAKDERMKRWVNMQLLTTYHHNFVRHLIEGELQRRVYALAEKGVPVAAPLLSKIQGEILSEFWGDVVTIDEGARLTWMRQPHYYSGLYPYSYSAGLTIGTKVARDIKEKGQPVVDKWLEVLKAGGTKPPLELAAMAGVDMGKKEPIREAVAYVGKLVDDVAASFKS